MMSLWHKPILTLSRARETSHRSERATNVRLRSVHPHPPPRSLAPTTPILISSIDQPPPAPAGSYLIPRARSRCREAEARASQRTRPEEAAVRGCSVGATVDGRPAHNVVEAVRAGEVEIPSE